MENLFTKITAKKIIAYQQKLTDDLKLSPSTIKRRLSSTRKFCEWATKQGYLQENPFISTPPIRDRRHENLSIPYTPGVDVNVFQKAYKAYHNLPATKYLHYGILIIFCAALGFGVYDQFFKKTPTPFAYSDTLNRPNRYLSFQGRLTDSSNNPISSATNIDFKLWKLVSAGTEGTCVGDVGEDCLWKSNTCVVTPDQDGIFSIMLGTTTGPGYTCASALEINENVFTKNQNVWLGIKVATDAEMTPRIQVATVGYALNAETLQGMPPGTGISSIPYINNAGDIVIAAASPSIQGTSGTFAIEGQTGVTIQAGTGVGGSITISPKGDAGIINITSEATTGNLLNNQSGANFGTVGGKEANNLYYGSTGTDSTNLNLLKLESGAIPSTKFTIDASGNASAAGTLKALSTAANALDIAGGIYAGSSDTFKVNTSGNITGGQWQSTAIAPQYGGMGQDWSGILQGSLPYFSGTGIMDTLGTGTSGYVLQTNGTSANPSWVSPSSVTGVWTLSGSSLYPNLASYNVGIGSTSTPANKLSVTGNADIFGNLGIGTTNPTSPLSVGSSSQFQVDSSGDIVKLKNLTYSWPAAHTTNGFLKDDGSGNLTWTTIVGAGGITGSGTVGYLPKWNTSSDLNNSVLYETGNNVGIGTTNPQMKLDVAGNATLSGTLSLGPQVQAYAGACNASAAGKMYYDASQNKYYFCNGTSWTEMGSGSGTSWWTENLGLLFPVNSTLDLAIGGNSTASANVKLGAATNVDSFIMGNLGIGTTTPATKLEVVGTVQMTGFKLTTNPIAGYFLTSDTNGVGAWADISATGGPWTLNSNNLYPDSTDYNVALGGNNAGTAKLYVNGNVGIGTTTPGAALDINGNLLVQGGGTIDTRAAGTLTLGGTTQTGLTLGRSGTTTSLIGSNFTAGGIGYGGSNTLAFTSAGSGGQVLLSGTAGAPSWGTLNLTYGGTNANLSGIAQGSLIYKGASALAGTDALSGILQGNGSSAPTALTGTANYLPKWSATAPYLTTASNIYDDGTNVGVGTTNPTSLFNVGASNQLGINSSGNLSTSGTLTAATNNTLNGLSINTGTITAGTWNGNAIAVQYGGTGQNWSGVLQGALPYFSNTGVMTTLGTGTSGYVLQTNGASANPSWVDNSNLGPWTLVGTSLYPDLATYNVGIGSTGTPGAKLDIAANLSAIGSKIITASNAGTEKFYIDKDGNLYAAGTILSGAGQGMLMTNNSSGTVNNRSLVILDTTTNSAFTTTTTPYSKSAFGVVTGVGLGTTNDANSDGICSANDICMIAVGGEVEVLTKNATLASRGDYLYTSDTAGQAGASAKQFDGLIGVVSNISGVASGYVKMIFKVQTQVTAAASIDKGSKHNEYWLYANKYTGVGEGADVNANLLSRGLSFDNLLDTTKTDSANTTVSAPTQTGGTAAPYRAGLIGGQTYSTATTDNASNTYLGSNTVNKVFYYDRTRDSSPQVQVELGLDPNWYNGVTLSVATSSAQFSQNDTITKPNPNLSTTYNGSLVKVTGTYTSNAKTIYITIKSPTTFDWTDYNGNAATGVTMTPGTAQTLTGTGVSTTFTSSTKYNTGDVFKIASWFVEPSGTTRGAKAQFPERSNIIATASSVDIIDADTQKLWMRFNQGTSYALGVDANNNPSSANMLNGKLYVSENGSSATGLYTLDFVHDASFKQNATDWRLSDSNLAQRNGTNTYNVLNTSNILVNITANDVSAAVIPNQPTQTVTVSGWGYIQGNNTANLSETVNFPYKFNSTPNVVANFAGWKNTTPPTNLEGCINGNPGSENIVATPYAITTTSTGIAINMSSNVALVSTAYWCYTWTATGQVSPRTFVAAATDAGVTIVNETDATAYSYSDITSDHYNSVQLTTTGKMYALNETQAQLEKWRDIASNTASEINGTPDKTWGSVILNNDFSNYATGTGYYVLSAKATHNGVAARAIGQNFQLTGSGTNPVSAIKVIADQAGVSGTASMEVRSGSITLGMTVGEQAYTLGTSAVTGGTATNTYDMSTVSAGQTLTFNFSGLTLTKGSTYTFILSTGTDNGTTGMALKLGNTDYSSYRRSVSMYHIDNGWDNLTHWYGTTGTADLAFQILGDSIPALTASITPTIPTNPSLFVTEKTSPMGPNSDTIYVGTDQGVSVIQDKESDSTANDGTDEQNGSVKYYTKDYISEEMVGDIRGMWPLSANGAISMSDASVKADTLTNNGTATFVTGVRGGGVSLNGTTQYLSCTDAACGGTSKLDTTGSVWSYGAWINSSNITKNYGMIITKSAGGGGANDAYELRLDSTTAKPAFNGYIGGSSRSVVGNQVLSNNTWYHLVVVYDGSNVKIYVNGQLDVSSSSITGAMIDSTSEFRIGSRADGNTYNFQGTIDEPFVTATALTAGQIKHMYEIGYRALQSHATTLGGGAADSNQQLGITSTGTNTVGAVGVDYNNQFMYVGTNSTTLGAVSKIDLNSDTNIKTYNSSANVPAGGTLLVDEDTKTLAVGYNLEAVGSAASGVKSMAPDNNSNGTSGNFISKTITTAESFTQAYIWSQHVTDSSDTSNIVTVWASNDGGSNYYQCNQTNADTSQTPTEYEYFCQFNATGSSLKIKEVFARGSTKTNTYLTRYGIAWIGSDAIGGAPGGNGLYTNNNSSVANGSYIDVAHNQNSSDLVSNGWRYNTTTGKWEQIDNLGVGSTASIDLMEYSTDALAQAAFVSNAGIGATGGTVTYSGGYTIHTFTSSGTFTLNSAANVEVLVVAGGGGGGSGGGGGGGAGGLVYHASKAVTVQTYTVTVGNGGAGADINASGSVGQNSVFGDITANGGGYGGGGSATNVAGGNGGSGGGGQYNAGTGGTKTQGDSGGGTGYGYNGGTPSGNWGGGGGGAIEAGETDGTAAGGDGRAYTISGSSVTYAGGGGGSVASGAGGVGGDGGGGLGGSVNVGSISGANGTVNTGGGGGGGWNYNAAIGGTGGSGIVIIRYPTDGSTFTPTLQDYSESTIKQQGSYALKGVGIGTTSLNKTITRTVSPVLDLTDQKTIKFDVRSSRTGTNLQAQIHDTGGTTSTHDINIASADTWQTQTWDISGVSNGDKNAIDQIVFKITNADAANTFYIDNMYSSGGNYLIVQQDANTARLYNYSGSAQNLRLDVITGGLGRNAGTVSLAPLAADVDSQDNSNSIWINKTGTGGNLLKLQSSGSDKLVLASTGALTSASTASFNSGGVTIDSSNFVNAARFVDTADSNYFIDPAAIGTSATFAGNVGIGTTSPAGLLHVKATPTLSATGGTITTFGAYTIHTFTSSGTFTPNGAGNVEYLVVGGGGGGGGTRGGGGGGGGMRTGTLAVTAGDKTVTIGGGGAAGAAGNNGSQGSDSVFDSITATGGGYGAVTTNAGGNGGSGGGGGTAGTGTVGQGNNGGTSASQSSPNYGCGGGGGAGAVGQSVTSSSGGNGGNGSASSISGSSVTYAGGGGGGRFTDTGGTDGVGGTGGGGNAGTSPTAGTANTGGGGGGRTNNPDGSGAAGGSGIVIVRYLTPGVADALVVNSTGKVGIGTTDPQGILNVAYNGLDSYTKLLLHADGTDASTTFADETGKAVTAVGTAQIDTAQKEFGTASGLFDGNSDYLTTPDHADWAMGTGDFTIDAWVRFADLTGHQGLFGRKPDVNNFFYLYKNITTHKWQFNVVIGGVAKATYVMTNNWGAAINTWYHIALVRNGTSILLFIDGVSQTLTATVPVSTNNLDITGTATMKIGTDDDGDLFNGWIDEFRVSKGIARWTANFTPPTSAYSPDTQSGFIVASTGKVGIGTAIPDSKMQVTGGGLCVGSDANCNSDNNTEGVVYSSATAMSVYDVAENYPTKDGTLKAGEVVSADQENEVFVERSSSAYSQNLLGIISTEPGVLLGGFAAKDYLDEIKVPVALSGRVPVYMATNSAEIKVGDFLTSSDEPGKAMKAEKAGITIGKALESWTPESGKETIIAFVNLSWHDPDVYLTDSGDLKIISQDATYSGLIADENNFQSIFKLINQKTGEVIKRIGSFAELIAANIQAGRIETQELVSPLANIEQINTQRISLAEISSSSNDGNVVINLENQNSTESAFGRLIIKGENNQEVASIDSLGNASFSGQITSHQSLTTGDATVSGTLYAEDIITKNGSFNDLLNASPAANYITQNITNIYQTATPSAESTESALLANNSVLQDASPSATMSEEEINNLINEILASVSPEATAQAVLAENIPIAIANSLSIGGTLTLADNSLNSIAGPLYLQNLGLGGIDLLAGKIIIDQQGNAVFEGNVTVKGSLFAKTIQPLPENDLVIDLANSSTPGVETESKFGNLLIKGINNEVVASIDASGSATFTKLNIASANASQSAEIITPTEIKTNATAGEAILPTGATEITIKSPFVTENTLIYVTPISDTQNKVLFAKAKKAKIDCQPAAIDCQPELGWFKVGINTPIDSGIKFNYWIIN